MSTAALRVLAGQRRPAAAPRPAPESFGQRLVDRGVLTGADLARAEKMLVRQETRLEDVLLAHRMVSEADLTTTTALHWRAEQADFRAIRPDIRLVDSLGVEACLRDGLLPWRRAGSETIVATSRPEEFDAHREALTRALGPVRMAITSRGLLQQGLFDVRQRYLAREAETLVPEDESCRGSLGISLARAVLLLAATLALFALAAPTALFWILTGWAAFTLFLGAALKAGAVFTMLRDRREPAPAEHLPSIAPRPTVSIMVPLFRERELAAHLVERLSRLTYPRELLDICLVVEEDDTITQATLDAVRLPAWMRQIIVPRGTLQTKPRALNFALGFCRGSIIGVYDAEDRPDPGQIETVVDRFNARGEDVACLQGILDFYNARDNWFARCFTIEYATWFRVVLPGLSRLGFVVPLGGTTLFFRRAALEKLGGWDAHNVTEDADLGVRLARHGYTTELIETVTMEEANCRPLSWIRQRSRWLKGYAMTYAVHMRSPRRLWRDLGARRFMGVQIVFLGTLSQFALAPILWSFWLLTVGLPHPAASAPHWLIPGLAGLFLMSEAVNLAASALALWRPGRRGLIAWVPRLHLYFPLGALAMYKALWELVLAPYYWDKTQHGHHLATRAGEGDIRIPKPPRRKAA